jgi:hypothetical protein
VNLSGRLACPRVDGRADQAALQALFDWYVGLQIPYETISNLRADVLIRTPTEIAASAASGLGGHCVEHALLFTDLLREHGFAARYVNGDHHDYVLGVVMTLAKPFTLVNLRARLFVCDTYYRRVMLEVPGAGGANGDLVARRIDPWTFVIESRRDGKLTGEDIVHEESTLADRRRQFEERYHAFSPFGITAPYYQVMKPKRCGLYYDPGADQYVVHEGKKVFAVSDGDLPGLRWLPGGLAAQIPAVAARNRRERQAACAFLETGLYQPFYRQLTVRRTAAPAAHEGTKA